MPAAIAHLTVSGMAANAQQRIAIRVTLATALMWACLVVAVGPLVYAGFRLIASTQTPEGGFEGMAIIFTLLQWGVVLLFPLYGFAEALRWRRSLQDELRKMQGEEEHEAR